MNTRMKASLSNTLCSLSVVLILFAMLKPFFQYFSAEQGRIFSSSSTCSIICLVSKSTTMAC